MQRRLRLPALAVRTRLIVGIAGLIALLATSAAVSYALLGGINGSRTELTDQSAPYFSALSDAALTAKATANDERGYLLTGDPKFLDEIAERVAKANASLAKAREIYPAASKESELVGRIQTSFATWVAAIDAEFALYKTDPKAAVTKALGDNRSLRKAYEGLFDEAQARSAADVEASDASLEGSLGSAKKTLLATLLLALVLGGALAVWITKALRRSLSEILTRIRSLNEDCMTALSRGLGAMATGDLTVEVTTAIERIEQQGRDEIAQVAETLNDLIAKTEGSVRDYNETRVRLGAAIARVAQTSLAVGSASKQMATTSEEVGRAVTEIAGAVSEVSQGAGRQVQMVEDTKRSTEETAEKAAEARAVADEGVVAAESANEAMRAVRDSSAAVTGVIRELAGKSEQIGTIVETITGIAGQTNLLALNAAIEAARAGEQGRGFAVVAEEVRKLAEESQTAASTISSLIEEIQAETSRAVAAVEDGAKRTDDGTTVVEQAREAFATIGQAVREIHGRIERISTATGDVATVAEESSASAEQVSASTEQTSASTQEIAASAQELARTAEELERLVGQFTLAA